jgi:Flp pilus assembly CpaE family ATPase
MSWLWTPGSLLGHGHHRAPARGHAGRRHFAVAQVAEPDLIPQRCAPVRTSSSPATRRGHVSRAIRRTDARRETAQGVPPSARDAGVLGAKGGAGTTTIAVNCGVELVCRTRRRQ